MTDRSAGPPPTRRIVTVRRRRPLIGGIVAIGLGTTAVAIGALVLAGGQALQVASADGRARLGNEVSFDAGPSEYAITLIADPGTQDFTEGQLAAVGCEVVHAGGERESLDPSSATLRTSSSIGVYATGFDGRDGPTVVTCRWEGSTDLGGSYVVAEARRAAEVGATIALVTGIIVAVAGVWALVIGLRGRPEIQPIGA